MWNSDRFAFDPHSNAIYDPVSKRHVSAEDALRLSSGSNPTFKYGVGGSDDEDDDIEIDGSSGSMDAETRQIIKERQRRKRLLVEAFSAITVLCIVALFVTVGLCGRSGTELSDAQPNVPDDYELVDSIEHSPNLLAAPPDDLDVLCDVTNVETSTGYAACRAACGPAKGCCDGIMGTATGFSFDSVLNCGYDNEEEMCDRYAPCIALTAYNGQEEGGESKDSGTTGFGVGGNIVIDRENEAEFVAKLCSKDSLITVSDVEACREVCSARACCFSDNGDDSGNCAEANPTWCSEYSACISLKDVPKTGNGGGIEGSDEIETNIFVPGEETYKEPVKDSNIAEVDKLCGSRSNLYSSGSTREACRKICKPRECCFAFSIPGAGGSVDDVGDNTWSAALYDCSDEFPHWCDEYEPCKNLYALDAEVNTDSEGSGSVSGKDVVQHSPQQEPTQKEEGIKKGSSLHYNGDSYSGREPTDNTSSPTTTDEICAMQNLLLTEGREECKRRCGDLMCCFDSDEFNCKDVRADECREHAACENLSESDSTPPFAVEALCALENLLSLEGRKECERQCEEWMCCFDTDDEYNCQENLSDDCLAYAACENLSHSDFDMDESSAPIQQKTTTAATLMHADLLPNGDGMHSTLPPTVNELCAVDNVSRPDRREECRRQCEDWMCCFDANKEYNCEEALAVECLEYAACKNLKHSFSSSSSSTTIAVSTHVVASKQSNQEVYGVCAPSKLREPLGREECKLLCAKRACCFMEGPLGCSVELSAWCDEYKPCYNLIHIVDGVGTVGFGSGISAHSTNAVVKQGGSSKVTIATTTTTTTARTTASTTAQIEFIDELCSTSFVKESDYHASRCRDRCDRRLCCFLPPNDADSCYTELRGWCEEYKVCWQIYSDNNGSGFAAVSETHVPLVLSPPPSSESADGESISFDSGGVHDNSSKGALGKGNTSFGIQDVDTSAVHTGETFSTSSVDSMCSDERLAMPGGIDKCRTACDKRKCCFAPPEDMRNCQRKFPAACNEYVACARFFERI